MNERGMSTADAVGHTLSMRGARLRHTLATLSTKRSSVDFILSTLESRLLSLESSLGVVQEATEMLVVSHSNVTIAKKETEQMLAHLDNVRILEGRMKRETLPTYSFSMITPTAAAGQDSKNEPKVGGENDMDSGNDDDNGGGGGGGGHNQNEDGDVSTNPDVSLCSTT